MCREPLARDAVENTLDARLILRLPLLFLRNVRLHDGDGRERDQQRRAHAPGAVARERRNDGDRAHEALRDRGALPAQQPRVRHQAVHRGDAEAQPSYTRQVRRLREHGVRDSASPSGSHGNARSDM